MKYAFTIDQETRRILSVTFSKYADKNAILKDELPTGETEEEKNVHNWLINEKGEFIYDPIVPTVSVEEQIAELKAELAASDYKMLKCTEARMLGLDLPYDAVQLHEERQVLRDKINELEES